MKLKLKKERIYKMFNLNSGYDGYRMSNRAVAAYENGEKPLSKWTKKLILSRIEELTEEEKLIINISMLSKCSKQVLQDYFLFMSSWHHTGKYCNETSFYDVDIDKLKELTENTNIINELLAKSKIKENKKITEPIKYYRVEYLNWYQRGKCNPIIDFGEVKGNWFYPTNGGKKSITSNGFKLIEEISKRSVTINRKNVLELEKAFVYQHKYKNLDKFLYRALSNDIPKTFIKNLKALRKKCIEVKKENLRKGWETTNSELLNKLDDESYIESRISKEFIENVKEQYYK